MFGREGSPADLVATPLSFIVVDKVDGWMVERATLRNGSENHCSSTPQRAIPGDLAWRGGRRAGARPALNLLTRTLILLHLIQIYYFGRVACPTMAPDEVKFMFVKLFELHQRERERDELK